MKSWLKAESYEDVGKFYDPKYAKNGLENFKADREWIIRLIEQYGGKIDQSKNVLDAGCGHGEFISALKGVPVCLGIDVSHEALKLATARNVENSIFLQMAIEEITTGLQNHFDVVTCLGALEHCTDIVNCFKVLLLTVKSGGILFLQMPLYYEGVMESLEAEENKKTNERFASMEEWIELFRPIAEIHAKLVYSAIVGQDAVLIYKKDNFYDSAKKIDKILEEVGR